MTDLSRPVVRGTFLTERPGDGFRARCSCGWAGPNQGYDVAAAETAAANHDAETGGCDQ